MADILVDTDLFIGHLRGARRRRAAGHRLHDSMVTRAERFAGSRGADTAAALLAPLGEIPLDRAIAERAGRIRREARIRLPDALIAATAIVRARGFATRNLRDFARVPGLDLHTLGDLP